MHRRILGYQRWDGASFMFVENAIDSFDVIMRKNIFGLKKHIFTIHNDLMEVMDNCTDIVNSPIWSSWAKSLNTVYFL